MHKKRVWQYKCDFCGKKNYSAGHMNSHERHCTMNPDRSCRMCKYAEDVSDFSRAMSSMSAACYSTSSGIETLLNKDALERELKALRDACGDCPACILAILRQKKIHPHDIGFDYKKEVAELWENDYQDAMEQPDISIDGIYGYVN